MAIFNSYVSLPEGISIFFIGTSPTSRTPYIQHRASGPVIRQTWLFPTNQKSLAQIAITQRGNQAIVQPPQVIYYLYIYI